MEHSDLISISQFAKIQRVSRQTLIYYDNIGIFKPVFKDTSTGYRYYSLQQVYEFDTIRTFTETYTPLSQIKEYISKPRQADDYFRIQQQAALLEKQILMNTMKLQNIQQRIDEYQLYQSMQDPFHPAVISCPQVNIAFFDIPYTDLADDKKLYSFLFSLDLPFLFGWGTLVPAETLTVRSFASPEKIFFCGLEYPVPENNFIRPAGDYLTYYRKGSFSDDEEICRILTNHLAAHQLRPIGYIYLTSVIGPSVTQDCSEHVIKVQVQVVHENQPG